MVSENSPADDTLTQVYIGEYARSNMAAQVQSDAELINRGAFFDARGQFTLSRYLQEFVELTRGEEPLYPHLLSSPLDVGQEAVPRLDDTLLDVWEQSNISTSNNAPRYLMRNDVKTFRDLLVCGVSRIRQVPGIGVAAIDQLGELHAMQDLGIEWQVDPSAQFIATFCSDLRQITARAIPTQYVAFHGTVDDVLQKPYQERIIEYMNHSSWFGRGYIPPVYEDELANAPEAFAERFTQASLDFSRDDTYSD